MSTKAKSVNDAENGMQCPFARQCMKKNAYQVQDIFIDCRIFLADFGSLLKK